MSFWSRTARVAVSLVVLMLLMAILVELTPLGEIKWMRVFFGVSALNFTLRATIPLVLGALSGILCERSGIINIGIEGMMLAGAFAGFVAKSSTNDWVQSDGTVLPLNSLGTGTHHHYELNRRRSQSF